MTSRLARAAVAVAAVAATAGCGPLVTATGGSANLPAAGVPYTVAGGGELPGGGEQTITAAGNVTYTAATLTDTTTGTTRPLPVDGATVRTSPLAPNRTWTVNLTRASGLVDTVPVTTGDPDPNHILTVNITPDGVTRGVGQLVTATFNQPIADDDKAAAAAALTTTGPPGRWRWIADDTAIYRPATYWPAHTTITTTANLDNVAVRTPDGTAVWGAGATTATWTTDDATIITVNLDTHRATVTRDGADVATVPISGGKPGYETTTGTKTIQTREQVTRMTNAGVTDEPYDLQVPWTMRITDSGEYLHSAEWNPQIGSANTSHGCTNLTVADAKWLYDNTTIGDVVVTVGPANPVGTGNGPGSWWDIPWETW